MTWQLVQAEWESEETDSMGNPKGSTAGVAETIPLPLSFLPANAERGLGGQAPLRLG